MVTRKRAKGHSDSQSNGSPPSSPPVDFSGGMRRVATMVYLQQKEERERVVIWRHPLKTMHYFCMESLHLIHEFGIRLFQWWRMVLLIGFISIILCAVCSIEGPHQKFLSLFEMKFMWCAYWVGLGVLSSVGLGTGLHTFVLYLGPHIAAVTLAAYECGTLAFPAPPYPDDIICPDNENVKAVTMWKIMSKVRLEAFMWGAGTALGELPPYFMARAARLSGTSLTLDEYEEFEQLQRHKNHPKNFAERGKLFVQGVVERVGFLGILACASIPNPLFDLAGITCGHFLVPFWTFFGATLIGKAVIKMHIQKLFVIITFSDNQVEKLVKMIKYIPYFGPQLQAPFKHYLQKQKDKLHHRLSVNKYTDANWLQWFFEKVVMLMVAYFLLSIVNSLAQNYYKRLQREDKKQSSPVLDPIWEYEN